MKILITGSSGFIGSRCVAAAKARGHQVYLFDQDIGWNIRTFTNISAWAPSPPPDCILHLAGYSSLAGFADHMFDAYSANVTGFLNVLRMAHLHKARLVYASSSAVYGKPPCIRHENLNCIECPEDEWDRAYPFPEDEFIDLTGTASHYGKSKLIDEMMAESFRTIGLSCLGLRIFNAYGKGDEVKPVGRQAPPTWMQAAKAAAEPMRIYSDGTQAKDFIHISDVVELTMRLLESDATGIVNVGTGVATSFNALADLIGGEREYAPIPNPESYQYFTKADTTRLLSIVGPYEFKSVEEGLAL